MTTHLPECWTTDPSDPPAWCICDELRACEERMLAKCITLIEESPWSASNWYAVDERASILTALRGLREKT